MKLIKTVILAFILSSLLLGISHAQQWQVVQESSGAGWSEVTCENGEGWRKCEPSQWVHACFYWGDPAFQLTEGYPNILSPQNPAYTNGGEAGIFGQRDYNNTRRVGLWYSPNNIVGYMFPEYTYVKTHPNGRTYWLLPIFNDELTTPNYMHPTLPELSGFPRDPDKPYLMSRAEVEYRASRAEELHRAGKVTMWAVCIEDIHGPSPY